jgi:hypothetical protein
LLRSSGGSWKRGQAVCKFIAVVDGFFWGEVEEGSDVVVEAIVGEVVAFRYAFGVVLEVGCEVLKLSGGLLRDYSSYMIT